MWSSCGKSHSVYLQCLSWIAVTMAFALMVLRSGVARSRIITSFDDPSQQLVTPYLVWSKDSNRQVVEVLSVRNNQPPHVADSKKEDVAAVKAVEEAGPATVGDASEVLQLPSQQEAQCNIFEGKWVEDHSGPLDRVKTCPILSKKQNCHGNGRPDSGYINWRWKPAACELPKLDALAFLELMRGKTLGFVGDSVSRNQYEALICSLWQKSEPKYCGNSSIQRWEFPEYSFGVVRLWSSWLVHASRDAIDLAPANLTKLHLDTLDEKIAEILPTLDVLVIATGHWWLQTAAYVEDGKVVGGHIWWNSSYKKQHDVSSGYGVAMKTVLKAILANPNYKGLTILRTYSPNHYGSGAWNADGSCSGKTKPLTDVELPRKLYQDTLYGHQIAAVQEALKGGENAARLRVMDVTRPFSPRADGHPGPYRNPSKVVKRGGHSKRPPEDCFHWCMPGPIDTWNEYLFAMLKQAHRNTLNR